jgi:hypothetical protein
MDGHDVDLYPTAIGRFEVFVELVAFNADI